MNAFAWLRQGTSAIALLGLLLSSAQAATISGRVTDASNGQPIAAASVFGVVSFFQSRFQATTDADGFYEAQASPGLYSVSVNADGYLYQQAMLDVGGSPVVADFSLTRAASIGGTVRVEGVATANERVVLFDLDQNGIASDTVSGDDGSYVFTDLMPGNYAACVIDLDDVFLDQCYNGLNVPATGIKSYSTLALQSGSELTAIDFSLQPGSTIGGMLYDRYSSEPIANAAATFVLYSSDQALIGTAETTSDANGAFLVSGIAPGNYYLEAGVPFRAVPPTSPINAYYATALHAGGDCTGQDPPCPFTEASLFSVPAGGSTGIDFDLRPGHSISGRVTAAETGLGIFGVTVKACEWIGLIFTTAQTTTAADGSYTLTHVVGPGEVSVSTFNTIGYADREWPDFLLYPAEWACPPFDGAGVTFTSADENVDGIDISLARAASVSGHVDPSTAGAEATVEILVDVEGTLGIVWYGTPDEYGDYHLAGLPAGKYYALAYFDAYQDCRVYAGRACADPSAFPPFDVQQATPIVLAPGETRADIDFPAEEIFRNGFDQG